MKTKTFKRTMTRDGFTESHWQEGYTFKSNDYVMDPSAFVRYAMDDISNSMHDGDRIEMIDD